FDSCTAHESAHPSPDPLARCRRSTRGERRAGPGTPTRRMMTCRSALRVLHCVVYGAQETTANTTAPARAGGRGDERGVASRGAQRARADGTAEQASAAAARVYDVHDGHEPPRHKGALEKAPGRKDRPLQSYVQQGRIPRPACP